VRYQGDDHRAQVTQLKGCAVGISVYAGDDANNCSMFQVSVLWPVTLEMSEFEPWQGRGRGARGISFTCGKYRWGGGGSPVPGDHPRGGSGTSYPNPNPPQTHHTPRTPPQPRLGLTLAATSSQRSPVVEAGEKVARHAPRRAARRKLGVAVYVKAHLAAENSMGSSTRISLPDPGGAGSRPKIETRSRPQISQLFSILV